MEYEGEADSIEGEDADSEFEAELEAFFQEPSAKFMDNQQVLENVITAITNIRGGVKKLLALKYKLAPRSKNEAVPEPLEDRRV